MFLRSGLFHYEPLKCLINQCKACNIRRLAFCTGWGAIFLAAGFYQTTMDELMNNGVLREIMIVQRENIKQTGEENVHLVSSKRDERDAKTYEARLPEEGEKRGWKWKGKVRFASLQLIPSPQRAKLLALAKFGGFEASK